MPCMSCSVQAGPVFARKDLRHLWGDPFSPQHFQLAAVLWHFHKGELLGFLKMNLLFFCHLQQKVLLYRAANFCCGLASLHLVLSSCCTDSSCIIMAC